MSRSTGMEERRHELLDDLCASIVDVLCELNITREKAEIAGAEVVARMVQHWGGQQLYIPKDYAHSSNNRAMAVYEACTGRNFPAVARQFDISIRSVYRIHNRIHAVIVAKQQPDMFHSE